MNRSTVIIGSILIFLGLFFLLRSFNLIWFSFGDLVRVFFPLALVGAGIWLMVRKKSKIQVHTDIRYSGSAQSTSSSAVSDDPAKVASEQAAETDERAKGAPSQRSDGKIRFDKMLGDMYVDCEGYNLSSVEISMGIGDLDLKVSGGILSKGLNRIIISGFIGDLKIFVPKDFSYFAHCSNLCWLFNALLNK